MAAEATQQWRAARVPEYVLTGEVADAAHPASASHTGYERVVLSDVSRHMLHYSDADRPLTERRGAGVCCAVAFRRKA